MTKKLASTALLLFCLQWIFAQDSIVHRIILIGDAGEMDRQQQALIPDAASRILIGKTTVVYLGDNIYPRGIGLPGSTAQTKTEQILHSQFAPLRSNGAAVYFIPGNHDWDRMGTNGLAKIKRQWQFLQEQQDSLLQLVPKNGCPDPVAIPVSDSVTIIAFDSEWWLFPFNKKNPSADCDCTTKDEVIAKLDELFYQHRSKIILLASHHPFKSYGTHGGYFSLKDHLFPLTNANKNLYLPLPVVGSLYPFLRRMFSNPEDTRHPLYKEMRQRVDKVFARYPNIIHVAGHEHGLQFIQDTSKQFTQIVSGAGAKKNHTIKGKYSLYGKAGQGYVIADQLPGGIMRFTYYSYNNKGMQVSFTHQLAYQPVQWKEEVAAVITGDSATVRIRPEYDNVSKLKRKLFGENYRKEFATSTTLPVIRIAKIHGGLTPEKRGGGMQTVSLRLTDKKGNEWVLRNLEKNPDLLLPEALRETFARDLLDDYMSAQHPFAPLVVPTLANAAGVPHANPVIGLVAPDTALGIYEKLFAGKVALLEEREPAGKSDNTAEVQETLQTDNDNSVDGTAFFKARLLDLLLGDWDRHADQWRWVDSKKGKEKMYQGVPRDRDQALYLRQGFIPKLVSRSYILPTLQDFDKKINRVQYALFKTNFINSYMASQLTHAQWTKLTNTFVQSMTDSVIDAAFLQLPAAAYAIRGKAMAQTMKERRAVIPQAMESFYRFINRIVDIQATDKNEWFEINSTAKGDLQITARKINKEGELKDTLFSKTYEAAITKEIRLYLLKGHDSVVINNTSSPVKLRIIGGKGDKSYHVTASIKKIRLYDQQKDLHITGESNRVQTHLSNDSLHTAFIPTNLYNITMPLVTAGYNLDDGFIFGAGFKHTQQGFRKIPFASEHQLTAAHSFSTKAYRIRYKGEWTDVIGKGDLLVNALAKAPDNTQNFFGRGNETVFSKTGDFKRYYRARFAIYQTEMAVRWKGNKGSSIAIGPAVQLYRYDTDENIGRFTSNYSLIGSYDSSHIEKSKVHAGVVVSYSNDTRNNTLFPAWGSLVTIRLQAFNGIGNYARSFMQVMPEISLYKSLNAKRTIILANRIGAGVSIGKTTFYQSQYLGGHDNLLGYRQYRFAGQHSVYNNIELRIKLADFASYLLPGQIGFTGFADVGRVWEKGETSKKWHSGIGGGLYIAPAQMAVLQLVAGYSGEGWYPYFTIGFRF